jgi:hypothetical protein
MLEKRNGFKVDSFNNPEDNQLVRSGLKAARTSGKQKIFDDPATISNP